MNFPIGPDTGATAVSVMGVYLVALPPDFGFEEPLTIALRPVTAVAPHPRVAELWYVTTENPEYLAFLPDALFET